LLWERELGLAVVLNVCVLNIVMGKGTGVSGCSECVCFEYCYGERELGLAVVMNVCFEYCYGKGNYG
jgi:hypothetical protein